MSNVYGKIDISDGLQKTADVGGTGLSGLVIGNDSGYTCKITLQGANIVRTLYAGTVDFFPIPPNQVWSGNVIIDPSADLNNISYWPGTSIYIDTFGTNELPNGTYPMNLNRTGNVGNQVSTIVGSSTNVQNDNNASGTSVVEATVLGSPTSNIQMYNDGSGWLGKWVNPTFTKIFQWFSSGSTALKLAASGLLTQILGNLQVDGTSTLTGNVTCTGTASFNAAGASIDSSSNFNGNATNTTTVNTGTVNSGSGGVNINNGGNLIVSGGKIGVSSAGDVIDASDGSNIYIKAAGGKIIFQSPNGTSRIEINPSTGIQFGAGLDVLYANSGAGETYLQGIGTGKIRMKKSDGTDLFSIDSSGNARFKGTVTASVTP